MRLMNPCRLLVRILLSDELKNGKKCKNQEVAHLPFCFSGLGARVMSPDVLLSYWSGESPAMREVMETASRAAAADTPVLLVGESGTGKEALARVIHIESPRHQGRFVLVSCTAIPQSLLESILLWRPHTASAGNGGNGPGFFEDARGGTLFFDEIADMPGPLQAKLLRVMEAGENYPAGAPGPPPFDARVIAATCRDLNELVEGGRFRQDLFYKLNVIPIHIPPLRERSADLPGLIARFLDKNVRHLGRTNLTVSPEALDVLRRYHWPGNVEELCHVVEKIAVLAKGAVVKVKDLPPSVRGDHRHAPAGEPIRPLAELQRQHITLALRTAKGNKTAAARLLGMDRKTLYRKLEAYKLDAKAL
jgi:two-component system response regulator AtoC